MMTFTLHLFTRSFQFAYGTHFCFLFCCADDKDTAVLLEEKGANVHEKDKEGYSGRAAVYSPLFHISAL